MNIVFNIKKTDNFQPKVYDLGQISTTLQNLLDSSKIVVLDKRPIVLKITDTEDNENFYMLNLEDYIGENTYGIGKDITIDDLIPLSGGGGSTPTPVDLPEVLIYSVSQSSTIQPIVNKVYGTLSPDILSARESEGYYYLVFDNSRTLNWDLNKVFISTNAGDISAAGGFSIKNSIFGTRVDIVTSFDGTTLSDGVLDSGFELKIKIEIYP